MKLTLILLVLVGALVVVGALVAGPSLRDGLASLAPDPPRTEVRGEPATVRTIVESIEGPGAIEPHTSVEIAAEVSARIIDLPVQEGQEVRRGDIICRLEQKDLKALLVMSKARRDAEDFRLRSERTNLQGRLSTLDFADRELKRMQFLHETGDVPKRDLDNAEERMEDLRTMVEMAKHAISVMESGLAAAEAEIERAQDGLENTVLIAPMDGLVTVLNVELGEVVTGSTTNPGTVLMTIADLSRMVHNAEVAESDIARVQIGQRAKLYINAYPDEIFSGTVRHIAWQRSINPNGSGYFRAEIEIDLQGRRIRSGLLANASIEVESHEGLAVRYEAIRVLESDQLPDELRTHPLVDPEKTKVSVVYRIVDGKAVCTPIRAGASDLTHRLIEAGLEEGEMIVAGPYKVLETIEHDELVTTDGDEGTDAGTDEGTGEDAGEDAGTSAGDA